MKSNKKEFTINVHLVNHQVFYTPIYLCEKDYKLKFTIDEYGLSDKKLVDELFKEAKPKEDEIDIFVTGGPDVVNYLREKSNTEKGKVFFWIPVVDRFPLPLVKVKVDDKDELHSSLSIRKIPELCPSDIFSPPEDTTLHYFLSKYYDNDAFKKKYLEVGLTDDEKRAIIEDLSKYNSLFKGKLRPQKNFEKIVEELKKDKNAWGFWLSLNEEIRKVKKFNPPMEVIVFTCIYTKRDVWENERKRNFLQDFCKHVSLNINEIHEFNWHYHKDKETKQYKTDSLSRISPVFKILKDIITTKKQKQQFIANLKFLAQHRIFATNLSNDLVLKGERFQQEKDKGNVDLYHKFGLYYWMSEGFVINAIKAFEEIHEKDMAQMAFLKSISATTHAIKTTINTLLSAPLNSLKSDYDDFRVDLLAQAKETLLLNAELVNLLSKLSIASYSNESKQKALLDSKLFIEHKRNIDLRNLIESRLSVRNLDKTSSLKGILLTNTEGITLNENFLKYGNLFPSDRFFEMIILTVIENCGKYGSMDNYLVNLTVSADETELTFSNKTTEKYYSNDPITGNLLIIDSILNLLNLGSVKLSLNEGIFHTKILKKNIF